MMRQDRFTEGVPVILSADDGRSGDQRLPRRNLGRGNTSGSVGGCLPAQDSSLRSE